jgi:antitoxin component YwqK of YwqJK toxin-antitoxin module
MECVKKHYDNGNVESERYLEENVPHRADGPAVIYYEEDGSVDTEYWYQNGKLHREDGPAIVYFKDGEAWAGTWYRKGTPLDHVEVQTIKDSMKKLKA